MTISTNGYENVLTALYTEEITNQQNDSRGYGTEPAAALETPLETGLAAPRRHPGWRRVRGPLQLRWLQ